MLGNKVRLYTDASIYQTRRDDEFVERGCKSLSKTRSKVTAERNLEGIPVPIDRQGFGDRCRRLKNKLGSFGVSTGLASVRPVTRKANRPVLRCSTRSNGPTEICVTWKFVVFSNQRPI